MFIERHGEDVTIRPISASDVVVRLPGSKSLTNRHLLCAALADGRSTLRGVSLSEDALVMVDALRTLGITIDLRPQSAEALVSGCGGHLPATGATISAGDAGTAMRFLTALVCLGHGRYALDGSPRMRERPIGQLVGALCELGAGIGYDGASGYPPLTVAAHGLAGGRAIFTRPVSSQYVSAILMVAPYAANDVMIRVDGGLTSAPYVDMTLHVMRALGVDAIEEQLRRFIVPSTQRYVARGIDIEPDASAATYFWTAAAITGGRARVAGLTRDSAQGDVGFVDVLARMGCRVEDNGDGLCVAAPDAGALRGVEVDLNEMPDTVQTLAVAALFADGPTEIRNVANLRVKETDRLAALHAELSKLGARVELRDDGLRIEPPERPAAAEIDTYNDHRMAMSFALAGLRIPDVTIRNAGCVRKSFPDFFDRLAEMGR